MDGNPLSDSSHFTIKGENVNIKDIKLDFNGQGNFQFAIPSNFKDSFFEVTFSVKSDELTNTKADSIAIV